MKQCTANIMMVRPASFQYNVQTAESNDYQQQTDLSKAEATKKAQKEFDDMVDLLESNDINVLVIDDTPSPEKPDALFPNNWISMHQNGEIFLYPMKTLNRSVERRTDIIDELREYFEVNAVHDWSHYEGQELALEGTGSIVFDHNNIKAYACLSPRTDKKLFEKFCAELGYEPISFYAHKSNGQEQYHTNVVMCIGDGFAVVCLDSITDKAERATVKTSLTKDGVEIIEITKAQLEEHFAGNMLNLCNNNNESVLVMSSRAKKSLTELQLTRLESYATLLSPNIDFIEQVGGGSARCMMAEIFLPELEEE